MLKTLYRDGSIRILKPTDSFYYGNEEEIGQKAKQICLDTGIPFVGTLTNKKNKVQYEFIIERNKPSGRISIDRDSLATLKKKAKESIAKHKSQLTNRTFTIVTKNGKFIKIEDLKEQQRQKKYGKSLKTVAA